MTDKIAFGIYIGVILFAFIAIIAVSVAAPVTFGIAKFEDTCKALGYQAVVVDNNSNIMCINYQTVTIILLKNDAALEKN